MPISPKLTFTFVVSLMFGASSFPVQPNPPVWPDTIHVFSPGDDAGEIVTSLSAELLDRKVASVSLFRNPKRLFIFFSGQAGHFSSRRLAFLFRPGVYLNQSIPVG